MKKLFKILPLILLLGCGCGGAKPEDKPGSEGKEANLTAEEIPSETEGKEAEEPAEEPGITAIYLGVKDYGTEGTNKENRDHFLYRFLVDDAEVCYSLANDPGYRIQNLLKENSVYRIQVDGETVTEVTETPLASEKIDFTPVVQGTPGIRTIKNFLATALEPVGTTLYIYGGGWDWQDEGSSVQARSIGVSEDWVRFFREHDASYNYKNEDPAASYYPYGEYNEYYYAGLDCSGYLGWALYNTLNSTDMEEGYVGSSTKFAKRLSEMGFGSWTNEIGQVKPGDIMSIKGHVWIALGTCSDGSVVIAHSTPSDSRTGQPGGGVQISAVGSDGCEAAALAQKYMSEYYPEWYERYEVVTRDPGLYFSTEGEDSGLFSWDTGGVVVDPEGFREMSAGEVLQALFQGAGG